MSVNKLLLKFDQVLWFSFKIRWDIIGIINVNKCFEDCGINLASILFKSFFYLLSKIGNFTVYWLLHVKNILFIRQFFKMASFQHPVFCFKQFYSKAVFLVLTNIFQHHLLLIIFQPHEEMSDNNCFRIKKLSYVGVSKWL